jgi:cell division protein FtsQ
MKADNVARSRKRFARRQRSRRWRRWRAVLAGTLTVALGVGVAWLVFFSPVLAVKGVEIEGTSLLTTDQVRSVAAVPSDEPLARVDLAAIEGRLRALAPVRSVDATREWPDRILISIDERVEVAVVEVGSGFKGIDQEGVLFRDFSKRPRDLPLITAPEDIGTDAMKEGTDVVSALPSGVRNLVDHVEVESIDQISLVLRDERTVVWGSADRSGDKAEVLVALLAARPGVGEYDVSVPGQPTTSN